MAIDICNFEELFNRVLNLIENQTIEFMMPKFSLKICQYKNSLQQLHCNIL